MKIITSHIHPPIPMSGFDWCAYYEGQEESRNYGATEQAAIADLIGDADLLFAAQCALNVLTLLEKEVRALGHNAKNVPVMLRAAIDAAMKESM